MLRNYILIAVRNIARHKVFSTINILGLAIGITCSLLLLIFIKDELSYDDNLDKQRIFRVIQMGDDAEHSSSLPFPAGPAIQNDYPELVARMVRLFNYQASSVPIFYKNDGQIKAFSESEFYFADSTFFDLFPATFIEGSGKTALDGPNLVVITESTAIKYFGTTAALGKTLRFEERVDLAVSGVVADAKEKSHLHYEFIASFTTLKGLFNNAIPSNWLWNPCWTYVQLHSSDMREILAAQLGFIVQKYYPESIRGKAVLELQSLDDVYLNPKTDYEIGPMSDIRYLYIFTALVLSIVLIAAINYANFTTARLLERLKEVGVRKAMGAQKGQLLLQFIIEAVILSSVALILSMLLFYFILPFFNSITDKTYAISSLINVENAFMILLFIIVLGVVAGFFPARFISSRKEIEAFKPKVEKATGLGIRRLLVIFQFCVSMMLITCTTVMYYQMQFIRKAKLGFQGDQILLVPVQRLPIIEKFDSYKDELLTNTHIISVTGVNAIVGKDYQNSYYRKQGSDEPAMYSLLVVRNDFINTLGIKMLSGQDFREEITYTGYNAIINATLAKSLGYTDPNLAIGQVLDGDFEGKVIIRGVCEDFHYASLKQDVGPLLLVKADGELEDFLTSYMLIRVKRGNIEETIGFISDKWAEFTSRDLFRYSFLDEDIDKGYIAENKFTKITTSASIIAIAIACVGLFGLAAYALRVRAKEIGVRKVLGATSASIFKLMAFDFGRSILIGCAIATPLSWYLVERWLSTFAHRTQVTPKFFLIGLATVMVVALLTISYHIYRATVLSAVDSLKDE